MEEKKENFINEVLKRNPRLLSPGSKSNSAENSQSDQTFYESLVKKHEVNSISYIYFF